jgi:hypothetical protein
MKLQSFIQSVSHLFQDTFNPAETMQWLTIDKNIFWSWGVSKKINLANKGLLLRVNGHHHNGYVLITLSPNDTYSVHIIKTNGTLVSTTDDIYCDQLQDFIDEKVERIPEYVD